MGSPLLEIVLNATLIIGGVVLALSMLLTMLHYPYDTDVHAEGVDATAKAYYQDAYEQETVASPGGRFEEKEEYVEKARAHAKAAGVPHTVESFVRRFGLQDGRVLEVGAGSGLLQHVVRRYVALDVSSRAHRFFDKPFVEASAMRLPFRDARFDALWSIWVLEHVHNPEEALAEMRRVVRDGGYILLRPAWNCDPWAAEGYEVRPFSDFSLKGKIIKASIPIRLSRWYVLLYSRQVRIVRTLLTRLSGKPSRFHFKRLRPNYSRYWVTDSDAVVSLDFFEMFLWFRSRGDECINCPPLRSLLFGSPGRRPEELIIRVNKGRVAAPHVAMDAPYGETTERRKQVVQA